MVLKQGVEVHWFSSKFVQLFTRQLLDFQLGLVQQFGAAFGERLSPFEQAHRLLQRAFSRFERCHDLFEFGKRLLRRSIFQLVWFHFLPCSPILARNPGTEFPVLHADAQRISFLHLGLAGYHPLVFRDHRVTAFQHRQRAERCQPVFQSHQARHRPVPVGEPALRFPAGSFHPPAGVRSVLSVRGDGESQSVLQSFQQGFAGVRRVTPCSRSGFATVSTRPCLNSSTVMAVASSAAAVGVGARRSAAKSARVKSVSCPTPVMTGACDSTTARTTRSSLNAHRSSMEPPPRASRITSGFTTRFRFCSASTSFNGASSPCTGVGSQHHVCQGHPASQGVQYIPQGCAGPAGHDPDPAGCWRGWRACGPGRRRPSASSSALSRRNSWKSAPPPAVGGCQRKAGTARLLRRCPGCRALRSPSRPGVRAASGRLPFSTLRSAGTRRDLSA